MEQKTVQCTILVATSGDTGSAIGNAFSGMDKISVVILYPEREITNGWPLLQLHLESNGPTLDRARVHPEILSKLDTLQCEVQSRRMIRN